MPVGLCFFAAPDVNRHLARARICQASCGPFQKRKISIKNDLFSPHFLKIAGGMLVV